MSNVDLNKYPNLINYCIVLNLLFTCTINSNFVFVIFVFINLERSKENIFRTKIRVNFNVKSEESTKLTNHYIINKYVKMLNLFLN